MVCFPGVVPAVVFGGFVVDRDGRALRVREGHARRTPSDGALLTVCL